MRILLDEQLPRQLAPYLVGHDVRTVQQESWAGLKNGELLAKAEAAGFSAFLTGDQNLGFSRTFRSGSWALSYFALGATRSKTCFQSFLRR